MTQGKDTQRSKTDFLFRTTLGRGVLVLALSLLFAAGYGMTAPVVPQCAAQGLDIEWPLLVNNDLGVESLVRATAPTAGIIALPCPPCGVGGVQLCDYGGQSEDTRTSIASALEDAMRDAANNLQSYIGNNLVDGLMTALLETLNQIELNLIDWWDTFWFYNLHPAMQDMMKQIHISLADQVRAEYSGKDSTSGNDILNAKDDRESEAAKTFAPSESAGVVATLVGGLQRAGAIGKAVGKSVQNTIATPGTNKQGAPGSGGIADAHSARHERFRTTFCDPDSNGGQNRDMCAEDVNPRFHNADTQITKQVYNETTMDIAGSTATDAALPPEEEKLPPEILEEMITNLVGDTAADPIPEEVLRSSQGQERFLNRRDFLARHAAVSAVPRLSMMWRAPGSQMGLWVKQVNQAAGEPISDISDNPSEKEIMEALTVKRFNTGKYAAGMITDQGAIEREKLIMATMYLMQLRKYYELLERTVLTLSVQVSLMADEMALPDINPTRPVSE